MLNGILKGVIRLFLTCVGRSVQITGTSFTSMMLTVTVVSPIVFDPTCKKGYTKVFIVLLNPAATVVVVPCWVRPFY